MTVLNDVVSRKIKHLNSLRRTVSELTARIEVLEKEIRRDMLREYAEVDG